MRAFICNLLFRIFGHRICCHTPEWTANVGQPWDTYDVAPLNLYNVIWQIQSSIRRHMTD